MLSDYCRCLVIFLTICLCMTNVDAQRPPRSMHYCKERPAIILDMQEYISVKRITETDDGSGGISTFYNLPIGVKLTAFNSEVTANGYWVTNLYRGQRKPWLTVQFPKLVIIESLDLYDMHGFSKDASLTLSAGSSLTQLYTGKFSQYNKEPALVFTTTVLQITVDSGFTGPSSAMRLGISGCFSDGCQDSKPTVCKENEQMCHQCINRESCAGMYSDLRDFISIHTFCPVTCGTCDASPDTSEAPEYKPPTAPSPTHIIQSASGEIDLRDKLTDQSTTSWRAGSWLAVDGNADGDFYHNRKCTHTEEDPQSDPWWMVDLGQSRCVNKVEIFNRQDCCQGRLDGAIVRLGKNPDIFQNPKCGEISISESDYTIQQRNITCDKTGRYLSVELQKKDVLTLCEVKAYECSADADVKKREHDLMELLRKLLA